MNFIGRQEQIEIIQTALKMKEIFKKNDRLKILRIEGPGGVGKTSLIKTSEADLEYGKNALKVIIEPSGKIHDVFDFVEYIIDAIKQEAKQIHGRADIALPRTEMAIKVRNEILAQGIEDALKMTTGKPELLPKYLKHVISLGKGVNKISEKTRKIINFTEIESNLEESEFLNAINALKKEAPNFLNSLGLFSESKNLRNSIRNNPNPELAKSLARDIETLLTGYNKNDATKPLPSKIKTCEDLILLIDDFESIQGFIAEFLAEHFLPELKKNKNRSLVIISGRDDLTSTHTSWDQHLKHEQLEDAIDLGPLGREEINKIATHYKVDSNQLWKDTQGYPYYMELWIEENRKGNANSIISLKKFYDRTTRWMSNEEQSWLRICLFIDVVNHDSIHALTNDKEKSAAIFEWFKTEASIRDPAGEDFIMRAYIRNKLLTYLKKCEPLDISACEQKAHLAGVFKIQKDDFVIAL